MLLQIDRDRFARDRVHDPAHLAVAQLRLRLAFELRVWHLHRNDRRQPLANVLSLEVVFFFLQELHAAGIFIDRTRQRRFETKLVRAAFVGVDVVRVTVDVFRVGIRELHRHIDDHIVLFLFKDDDILVQRLLVAVQERNELADAIRMIERFRLALSAFVDKDQLDPFIKEGKFR